MTPRALANALHGLSLLLRFDGRAWEFFDKTPRGFWLSYTVAFIAAPFHFTHVFLSYGAQTQTLGPIAHGIVAMLSYVITWTLFPFAMTYVTQLLGRAQLFFWHMVPYNWFQLPIALPLFILPLLVDFQILPADVFRIFNLLMIVPVAIYTTFIAAVGLRVPVATALSLVVLDFTLTILAAQLIGRI